MKPISLPGCHEPVSAVSHLLGAAVFLSLAVVVIRRSKGNGLHTAGLTVMSICTVQLLILSSLYHMSPPGHLRNTMHLVDVSAIFLMIAGSLTPVHIILFQGAQRWVPLAIAWIMAFCGIAFRWEYGDLVTTRSGIAIFVVLGWGTAITTAVLWQRYGWRFIRNGVLSGVTYTLGAAMLAANRPILVPGVVGPHELWHLAVLCALGFYWRFIFQFAEGQIPVASSTIRLARISEEVEGRQPAAPARRAA
ncbi:MAG: hemolysin III family protein [Planctomycetaceae bacterium]